MASDVSYHYTRFTARRAEKREERDKPLKKFTVRRTSGHGRGKRWKVVRL